MQLSEFDFTLRGITHVVFGVHCLLLVQNFVRRHLGMWRDSQVFDRCKCSDSVTVILKCPFEISFCDVFQVSEFSGVLMMSFVR